MSGKETPTSSVYTNHVARKKAVRLARPCGVRVALARGVEGHPYHYRSAIVTAAITDVLGNRCHDQCVGNPISIHTSCAETWRSARLGLGVRCWQQACQHSTKKVVFSHASHLCGPSRQPLVTSDRTPPARKDASSTKLKAVTANRSWRLSQQLEAEGCHSK